MRTLLLDLQVDQQRRVRLPSYTFDETVITIDPAAYTMPKQETTRSCAR